MIQNKKTYVLSLGGSLIVPDEVDYVFVKNFIKLIARKVEEGNVFVIVCGGGGLSKKYNYAANKVKKMTNEELDWIGIHATRYNAEFMRILFGNLAYGSVVIDPRRKVATDKPVIIGAGYEPGWSTDYDAVCLAKAYKVSSVANLSNVDYVYDRDPNRYKKVKPIKNISWRSFIEIVGEKWSPRMNKPFDPIATREAMKMNLKVAILNGKKLSNVEDYLNGKDFVGTLIS